MILILLTLLTFSSIESRYSKCSSTESMCHCSSNVGVFCSITEPAKRNITAQSKLVCDECTRKNLECPNEPKSRIIQTVVTPPKVSTPMTTPATTTTTMKFVDKCEGLLPSQFQALGTPPIIMKKTPNPPMVIQLSSPPLPKENANLEQLFTIREDECFSTTTYCMCTPNTGIFCTMTMSEDRYKVYLQNKCRRCLGLECSSSQNYTTPIENVTLSDKPAPARLTVIEFKLPVLPKCNA